MLDPLRTSIYLLVIVGIAAAAVERSHPIR